MKFAIIAAGEGSRLQQEGVAMPKPLVKICGEAMIDRLIRIFRENGATEIDIIVNTLNPLTEKHFKALQARGKADDLRIVVKSTPSSMHSFYELSSLIGNEPFCLTTVDTIFKEDDFSRYIAAFQECECDGMMAVTDFIDDEKPLYISTNETMGITGFHDTNIDGYCRYISGGIYALHPKALATLHRCIDEGQARMRNFQRALVADGLQLQAHPFSKILDVDHAEDIVKAEAFICQSSNETLPFL